ncbi:MAG: hypothetical protein LBG72_01380 [Spirochaetaceae bacterium]|jgi:hypothetical protein|nr:hypothetical protein [Spirochaetaceae bacterium]
MKKNKLILALIALVTFGFVLVGCGDGAYTEPPAPGKTPGGKTYDIDELTAETTTTELAALLAEITTAVNELAGTEYGTKFTAMSGTITTGWAMGNAAAKEQIAENLNALIDAINEGNADDVKAIIDEAIEEQSH